MSVCGEINHVSVLRFGHEALMALYLCYRRGKKIPRGSFMNSLAQVRQPLLALTGVPGQEFRFIHSLRGTYAHAVGKAPSAFGYQGSRN